MPNIAALITVAAVMFAVLGAITLIAHIYNLNNIKSKTVGDGQHGTARKRVRSEETCGFISTSASAATPLTSSAAFTTWTFHRP